MPTWIYPALIIANIPIYYGLYRLFFRDVQDLIDAVVYWIKPDMWSWFDGEFMEDLWAEFKLGAYLGLCGGCVYLELYLLKPLWGS